MQRGVSGPGEIPVMRASQRLPMTGGAPCRADCTIIARGDGTFDPGEQCDDGNVVDGGNKFCKVEAFCGDG